MRINSMTIRTCGDIPLSFKSPPLEFNLGLSWEQITLLVERTDNQVAHKARLSFHEHQRYLRGNLHAYFKRRRIKPQSTNLKTFFGSSKKELASALRAIP
jgi:hypothetical protein